MSSNNVTPTTSPVKPKKPINPIRNKPLHASPTRPSASKRAVTISADNESAFQLASVDVTCSNIQSNSNNHTGDNNQHAIHDLTEQLNQMFAKHAEERYWWNLEREKMQHDKQMLQDRLHKLLHVPQDDNLQRSLRPLPQSLNEVQELVQSLEQQEKMVRLLHAQVSLVQSSGDAMVKTYKDELATLMATKTQSQVHWKNQISQLEKERDHLRVQLQAAEQQQKSVIDAAPPPPPVVERALAAAPSSNEVKRLQKELHRLKKDYSKLNAELLAEKRHAKSAIDQATQDRKDLAKQVEQLQSELNNALHQCNDANAGASAARSRGSYGNTGACCVNVGKGWVYDAAIGRSHSSADTKQQSTRD
ncbi:hypothetical protein MPSEU_000958900 [Mayamaea pseudoterrestris]|nr:hypothetical protein MPSEU_000958900 [Mayamaea pseudoterrestris]